MKCISLIISIVACSLFAADITPPRRWKSVIPPKGARLARPVFTNPYNIPPSVVVTNMVITAPRSGHIWQSEQPVKWNDWKTSGAIDGKTNSGWMTWVSYLESGESISLPVRSIGQRFYQFVPLEKCNNIVPRPYFY